jgi:hypothetical protein
MCLDGHHQGATIAHENTHDKYLRTVKIHYYVAWTWYGEPYDVDNGS